MRVRVEIVNILVWSVSIATHLIQEKCFKLTAGIIYLGDFIGYEEYSNNYIRDKVENCVTSVAYMGITRYPLPQKNGNLSVPFFVGNYLIVFVNNIINDCACILMVHLNNIYHDHICHTKKSAVTKVLKFSQHNSKLTLPRQKQGNYPFVTIYSQWNFSHAQQRNNHRSGGK